MEFADDFYSPPIIAKKQTWSGKVPEILLRLQPDPRFFAMNDFVRVHFFRKKQREEKGTDRKKDHEDQGFLDSHPIGKGAGSENAESGIPQASPITRDSAVRVLWGAISWAKTIQAGSRKKEQKAQKGEDDEAQWTFEEEKGDEYRNREEKGGND